MRFGAACLLLAAILIMVLISPHFPRTQTTPHSVASGATAEPVTRTVTTTVEDKGCRPRAVQSAIDHARENSTVIVPNGTCTWNDETGGISIHRKAIRLQGESAGGVTINYALSGPAITITESPNGRVEVSQLHFVSAGGQGYTVLVYGGGRPVDVHHNSWTGIVSAMRFETLHGLVWSNTMDTENHDYLVTGSTQFVSQKVEGVPDSVWLAPSTMGRLDPDGEHNLYIEDNAIRMVCCGAFDPDSNARMVIRHNTLDNSATASHGADTSAIGARHVELYDNTFKFDNFGDCNGSRTTNLPYLVHLRGGTWVITGNTVPLVSSCAFGDKISFLTTVMNLQRNDGPYGCWGDGNHPNQHYPAPHQLGQGSDGRKQVLDPAYIWDNAGPGANSYSNQDYGAGECQPPLASVTTYLVTGRDVILGQPKPGWERYPYPHPRRSGR